MSRQFSPPQPDEIEISLFGPGYGEAIAVHLGNSRWVLVDSCIEPETRMPASLQYLRRLGVDVEIDVRMIVISHWHDDHVRGIGEVVRSCHSATVVISDALRTNEFEALMGKFRLFSTSGESGLEEFGEVLNVLEERKQKGVRFGLPERAKSNQLLRREYIVVCDTSVLSEIWSLSPSSNEVTKSNLAFAGIMPPVNWGEKRIATPSPNHTSVVIWCHIGDHFLLLGADLEQVADPTMGWTAILNESNVLNRDPTGALIRTCPVFKVSHHGAQSGHEQRVWDEVLIEQPWAILTSYNRGGQFLPNSSDISRMIGLTSRGYITAPPRSRRPKFRQRVVDDFLAELTKDVHEVNPGWGHVRLRCAIPAPPDSWSIELFGTASSLSRALR